MVKNSRIGQRRLGARRLKMVVCGMIMAGYAQAETYIDPGRSGDAASWRTPDFNANWGLNAIHADAAYAAGYTGQGQQVGIFDTPVNHHPEFAGDGKLTNVVTQGI
ncbi:hypothetical protein, partial [uncultured Pluralibacter sp.]|uniref:hypothetical protein n=1 Tax=uncultured Pluralibacter sp. TaxID=1490864 RepID=UPI0026378BD7